MNLYKLSNASSPALTVKGLAYAKLARHNSSVKKFNGLAHVIHVKICIGQTNTVRDLE